MSDTIRKLTHTAAEVDDNIDEVVAARGEYDSLDERLDATEVPEVGADDDGKVLKATYSEGVGTYTWEDEGGGTTDYADLSNKPSINNVTLSGNKTASDLGIGEVPEVGVNDDGKVLKASYTGGVGTYSWQTGGGGGGGTSDYSDLDNKPQINSITLSGNKTSSDLGLQSEIDSSHKLSADLIDDTSATNKFVTASEKNTWNGKQDALTFDNEPTASSNNPVKSGGVYTALSGKVDVESGKGLSANDFTDTLKSKLDGIASGAEVNVQSDWNQTNNAADDFIKNKPTLGTAAAAATTDFATAAQGTKADSAIQSAGTGLSKSGTTINHSNSVTAKTTRAIRKISFDAQGHITGSAELSAAESDALSSGIDSTKVAQITTNKNNISSLAAELHALLPNITASTTIQDYVGSLSKGAYTAFIANVSNPSDSPIDANCFVNIYVYSENTAAVELIPLSNAEMSRTYTMRKVAGVWRGWYMVEGTPVASSTQS